MAGEDLFFTAGKKLEIMQVREALELFQFAELAGYDPDQCAAGRWTCHMLLGNLEFAWGESDAIQKRGQPDPHRFWDGRPFTGRRVLLRCLHGLGDTLQFVRYAPLIRQQAHSLVIEAQPTLKRLLQQAGLADCVMTWGESEAPWDQQMEVMELPRIFGTTLHTIPNMVPYIQVNDAAPERSGPLDNDRLLRIGLVWAASTYNPARSVPIECVSPLFDTPGAVFFSLQAGAERAQIEPWATRVPCLYDPSEGVLGTAKSLAQVDLVITADTMMAHLAGAMGKPVWTLLPYECDWRWMLDREDSPWYPTMRLFRQPEPDRWQPVIARVQRELNALSRSKYAYPAPWARRPPNLVRGA